MAIAAARRKVGLTSLPSDHPLASAIYGEREFVEDDEVGGFRRWR
jgi:hypothetical protein